MLGGEPRRSGAPIVWLRCAGQRHERNYRASCTASGHHGGVHGYGRDPLNEVIVRWSADDDGTGKLHVAAATHGFAGTSGAWFNRQSVLTFAHALAGYPLPQDGSCCLSGGFGEHGGQPAQEHVGIAVGVVGSKGQIGFRVHLATEAPPDTRPEARHDVRLELLTTYQRIAEFSGDLAAVVEGTWPEAILGGERLA